MKKCSSITLGLLAAAALVATTGCNRRTEVQDCIDQDRHIVDSALCDQQDEARRNGYIGRFPYYWNYGGSAGGHLGDVVYGGSASPTSGFSAVSRGGFGSSFGGAHGSSAS
jgi:hypothetical protein